MVFGYVLISTKSSYEHDVADKLSLLDEVVDIEPLLVEETALADPFFEECTLIAKLKGDNPQHPKEIVDEKIHTIHGVKKTKIALRPKS